VSSYNFYLTEDGWSLLAGEWFYSARLIAHRVSSHSYFRHKKTEYITRFFLQR
jgi:hypothetical protein